MPRDVPYREAVSALTWVALATHPIIILAGAAPPFFRANARPALLEALKQTSRHLSFTHGKASSPLKGSVNANDTAKDWHAASRRMSLVNSGTVSQPSNCRIPPPHPPPSPTPLSISSPLYGGEAGRLTGFLQGALIFLAGFQPQLVFNLC